MTNLDHIIKKNREIFDSEEPREGHADRFREMLGEDLRQTPQGWWNRYGFEFRIAAGFALFLTVAILHFTGSLGFVTDMLSNRLAAAELPVEVKEMLEYYNVLTNKKMGALNELSLSEDDSDKIRTDARKELQELDTYAEELKSELAMNSDNERVKAALVLNRKKQSEILDKIINSVKDENN